VGNDSCRSVASMVVGAARHFKCQPRGVANRSRRGGEDVDGVQAAKPIRYPTDSGDGA
jgi:hypothetical protein